MQVAQVLGVLVPALLLAVLVVWLTYAVLRRVFGVAVARLYLALMPLALVALADFVLTPVLWLIPHTLWPPLHPAMTWLGMWHYLNTPAGKVASTGVPATEWWRLAVRLLRTRPEPGWVVTQIPFAVAAYSILWWVFVGRRRTGLRAAPTATHGSSRWRKASEVIKTLARVGCDRPAEPGVVMGSDGRNAWVTRKGTGNEHVLLVGPSRRGKSRRSILPTIWSIGHHRESMIVGDPKGELHSMSSAWLQSQGYEVVQLDLLRPGRGGGRWNPLAAVTAAYERGDHEEASRLAWGVGNVLAWSSGTGQDPIWPQAEESLIAALCLSAALEAPEGARHMASAYRTLIELGPADEEGVSPLDSYFRSLDPMHPARLAYGTASLSESRTRASIFTGTSAHLRLWGDPGVAWLTSESNHDPANAGKADKPPQAIFLLLPDEAKERWPIASLYIHMAYAALAGVARENGGRLGRRCWFLLDEFGNLPKVPDMGEKLTIAAGRGVHFLLAVQSLAQLRKYGEDVRAVIEGNCDTKLVLGCNDEDTAKAISAMVGTYTVRTTTTQHRPGMMVSGSEGATGRPLLTVDEALRWPVGEALVIQGGQFPVRLPLADLSAWRAASAAFQPAAPSAVQPVTAPPTWCPGADDAVPDAQPEQAPVEEVVPAAPSDVDTEAAPVPAAPVTAPAAPADAANRSAFRR